MHYLEGRRRTEKREQELCCSTEVSHWAAGSCKVKVSIRKGLRKSTLLVMEFKSILRLWSASERKRREAEGIVTFSELVLIEVGIGRVSSLFPSLCDFQESNPMHGYFTMKT